MKALQQSGRFIQEKVREAVDLFGQKLTEENPPADQRANMAKILIPHTTVGMLIGRQGCNQRAIQAETGVRMEFSPKPDFSPIMERCLTLSGSAVQINMAMDKVLEKIKADPQSGSCPNLVYNMGGNMSSVMGDPSGYAMASAMNLEHLLKLAYANPYALQAAAAGQPTAASFAYPGAAYLATPGGAGAASGLYQSALAANQAMLDQQTAALYASMGLAASPGFHGGLGSQGAPGHQQQQQHMMPAVTSQHHGSQHNAALAAAQRANALQKEGHTLTALNSNALLGGNLTQQNQQLLAAAGLLPNGSGTLGASGNQNATGHFLADNSSGANSVSGALNNPSSLTSALEAPGVYMTSLPSSMSQSSGGGFQSSFNNNSSSGSLQNFSGISEQQLNPNLTVETLLRSQQNSQNSLIDSSNQNLLNPLNTSALQNAVNQNGQNTGSTNNHLFRNGIQDSQVQSGHGPDNPNAIMSHTMEVEDNIVGAVLGVAGKTLIEIQNLSNTRIQVSPKGEPSSELRRLTIMGSPKAVMTAAMLIEQRIRMTQEIRALQGKVTV
ncbi:RNA-binding protein Nova-2-like isoform X2 [Symsagittifera roscoffensis]